MINNENEGKLGPFKKFVSVKFGLIILFVIVVAVMVVIFAKSGNEPDDKKETKNSAKKNIIQDNSPGKVVAIDNLEENLPQSPEVIAQGKFINVEQAVSGKALFIKGEEGVVLRFENFKVINGQNIHVYLSPVPGLEEDDLVDLGLLKSTAGNFNYPLNKSIDIAKYKNVIIWSNTFNAFFGYAGLYGKDLPPEVKTEEIKEEVKTEEAVPFDSEKMQESAEQNSEPLE